MTLRRWIAVLAAIGMLIHTAVVVRHSGIMLSGALHAEAASLAAASSQQPQVAVDEAPCPMHAAAQSADGKPGKPAAGYKCPICAGVSATVALADAIVAIDTPHLDGGPDAPLQVHEPLRQPARLWPPNRGPPSSFV